MEGFELVVGEAFVAFERLGTEVVTEAIFAAVLRVRFMIIFFLFCLLVKNLKALGSLIIPRMSKSVKASLGR